MNIFFKPADPTKLIVPGMVTVALLEPTFQAFFMGDMTVWAVLAVWSNLFLFNGPSTCSFPKIWICLYVFAQAGLLCYLAYWMGTIEIGDSFLAGKLFPVFFSFVAIEIYNCIFTFDFSKTNLKPMKKALKWTGIILLAMAVGLIVIAWGMHEARPKGTPSSEADVLANKMLQAVNKAAWDTTAILQWTFPGGHDYLWDKGRDFVQVTWDKHQVLLHTKSVTGQAYTDGQLHTGEDADQLIQDAWAFFCNDSWWFNAPVKAFDPGTARSMVTLEDGREGLMVEYGFGGVTPGDAYVWILDESGLPESYKMWVSIIPVGGVEFSWEAWQTLPTGAKIAALHKGLKDLPITNVKGAASLEAFGLDEDPFERLVGGK